METRSATPAGSTTVILADVLGAVLPESVKITVAAENNRGLISNLSLDLPVCDVDS